MLDKKIFLLYLIISFFAGVLITGIIIYFWFFEKLNESPEVAEEKRIEEILQSLTAPGVGDEVSEDIINSLTAPKKD